MATFGPNKAQPMTEGVVGDDGGEEKKEDLSILVLRKTVQ